MPAGRPSGYDPAFCAAAREILGRGHSVLGLAGKLGVSKATVYNWMEAHPEFLDAVRDGQVAAVAHWEEVALGIASGAPGNATMAIFGLKNRAADEWRDKIETEHSGGVNIVIDGRDSDL